MIWFKDRKNLDELYKKWVKENKIADDSFNVITFLEANNLLDREQVKKFLGDNK